MINEEWPCLQCGQCKFFKVDADIAESTCKRLDHKTVKFAVPAFKSYDCGQFGGGVCSEFQPAKWCKWLYNHWTNVHDFINDDGKGGLVSLCINGDTSVRYGVLWSDWFNGTFQNDDGSLKWVEKRYYKKRKVSKKFPIGYELVRERREMENDLL